MGLQKWVVPEEFFRFSFWGAAFLFIFYASGSASAAELVPLGKGSYASEPPSANAQLEAFLKGPDRLDPSLGAAAYPSNDIWSFGIWSNEKEGLSFGRPYLMPLAVSSDPEGFQVAMSNSFDGPLSKNALGDPLAVLPSSPEGAPVSLPRGCQRLLRVGDWSMAFRFTINSKSHIDLTTVRGMPMLWLETAGAGLRIPTAGYELSDLDGKPFTDGPNVLLKKGDRRFALYAGGTASLQLKEGQLVLPPGVALAIATPLAEHKPGEWRSAAMALPRDTKVEWVYDRAKGRIRTTWTITTEKLAPDAGEALQGWLPHCWRHALDETIPFLEGNYLSPRGKIKLARGNVFRMSWPVSGLLPSMPPPLVDSKEAPYDPARFKGMLAKYAGELTGQGADGKSRLVYGNDTYFGGKDVLKYAQIALAAHLTDSPDKAALVEASRGVLSDWFTWTPGETAHYWARYEKLGAFVGFAPSFNSQEFRDTHFHCGYFTLSAAIQGAADPGFIKDYGEVAKLVAKQYANWDRSDKRFPFLRTFDLWAGHSFASAKGNAPGDSANQESSSEAMSAWAGVGLLGAAMGDENMIACGLMGYAIEGEAVKEYWNNYYGWKAEKEKPGSGVEVGNWPESYRNSIVGIVSQGGNRFGTFFSGSPYHIYGIQWLPMSPALQYLSYGDQEFGLYQYEQMRKLQAANPKTPGFDLETMDQGDLLRWSNVMAGYLALIDSDRTAKRWEAMWQAGNASTQATANTMSYYFMHAYRQAGILDPKAWADQPTASVYYKQDGSRTLVAWNPGGNPLVVKAYDEKGELGSLTLPAHALMSVSVKGR